jgi:hypothetical protein
MANRSDRRQQNPRGPSCEKHEPPMRSWRADNPSRSRAISHEQRPDIREQSNLTASTQRACKRGGVHIRVFDAGKSLPRERSVCFGHDPHRTAARRAGLDVNAKYPFQTLRPGYCHGWHVCRFCRSNNRSWQTVGQPACPPLSPPTPCGWHPGPDPPS